MFVTLAYAELREVFLSRPADIRSILAADLGYPDVDNMRIDVYEVLLSAKQNLFAKVRDEASRLGIYKVWHRGGTILARKTTGSSAVSIFEVGDLLRLND